MQTPWGAIDLETSIAPGITFVSTPSHGGFRLTPGRNMYVPLIVRERTFNHLGLKGWYEEDCDAALVVVFFPECFPHDKVQAAHRALASEAAWARRGWSALRRFLSP